MPNRPKQSAVVVRLKRRKVVDPREVAFNLAFGARLKVAREEVKGLTQRSLAERLGIGYDALKKYEYGTRAFPLYLLRDLASILDKPISWLLTGR